MPGRSDAVYVVRIWYEADGTRRIWRASVTDAYRNEREFFSTLQALCTFFVQAEDNFALSLEHRSAKSKANR